MRKNWNPQKDARKIDVKVRHKIIIVVFIPENDEYYSEMFDVFKTCLKSLQSTINSQAQIMVVNNGSSEKVFNFINAQLQKGFINSVLHHEENIGKMDALVGAARSVREELITVTDTDILFTTGWQEAVERIFDNFPKAGSVSPIPVQANALFYNTNSVLKDIVLKKLQYRLRKIPENFEAHNKYLESINWGSKKSNDILWPVVSCNKTDSIVGSGHQVMTLKKEIFLNYVPTNPSRTLVGGHSEYIYGDEPIDKAGFYRLATYNNYAYHMGNILEPWMIDILNKNSKIKNKNRLTFNNQVDCNKKIFLNISYKIKKLVFKKLFKLFYNHKSKQ